MVSRPARERLSAEERMRVLGWEIGVDDTFVPVLAPPGSDMVLEAELYDRRQAVAAQDRVAKIEAAYCTAKGLPDGWPVNTSGPDGDGFAGAHPPFAPFVGAPGTGGVPVAADGGQPPDADVAGFCYLRTVRDSARPKMLKALGRNPYLSEVVAWLQRNVGEHSPERLRLSYGCAPLDMHGQPAFVQAHVVEDPHGIRLKQLLNLPTVDVRLGADRQAPTAAEVGSPGPSARNISVAGQRTVVEIPFAMTLRHTAGAAVFSPRASSSISALTKYFESAELLGFSVSASVGGGATAVLAIGIGTSSVAKAGVDEFMNLPYMTLISGSDDGLGKGDLELPQGHGFGREIKAVSVGNPDPVFHFLLEKAVASYAFVRGVVTVSLAGRGVSLPMVITPASTPRA